MGFSQAKAITIQDDFSSDPSTNWQLNGDAVWDSSGKWMRLTPAGQNKKGSMWYKQSFDLSKYSSFTASFKIYLGIDYSWYGADGITFAVIDKSKGLNALGNYGGSFGYGGIDKSFAVEFDTYQNSTYGDPSDDHIGIDKDGNISSLTTAEVGEMEDGEWHNAKVTFDIINGVISVSLDGKKYIDNYKIEDFSPFEAYFGFTGGTGGRYNNQAIDNFNLTLNPVPIPSSMLLLLTGLVGSFYLRRQRS